jgi:hypothetical protein
VVFEGADHVFVRRRGEPRQPSIPYRSSRYAILASDIASARRYSGSGRYRRWSVLKAAPPTKRRYVHVDVVNELGAQFLKTPEGLLIRY